MARSRPAPAKRITKAKQLSKKKKITISTTFSSSEDEAEPQKVAARRKKGRKSLEKEGADEDGGEDFDEEVVKEKALKADFGIRVQKLHKNIVEHKHNQFLTWQRNNQGQLLDESSQGSIESVHDQSRKSDDDSDEEEVSLSARRKSKASINKTDKSVKKPQPRGVRKSTSSVKASISFDSSDGETVNMSAALDAVEKLSEEELPESSVKSPPSKRSKPSASQVESNSSQSDKESEDEPEGTVLPDSLRGAPELREFWRILALEVGDEEEVEDLRTDAQLERRIQEVGMGDVVSRELERKAEARRHKEDQRHLAQHNLRFSRVNLSNVRKSDHWNSDCEDMVDNWPSKEERVNELNKGLQLIKVKLDQRLGRSPSAAKSPKKQRKSRNISEEEGS